MAIFLPFFGISRAWRMRGTSMTSRGAFSRRPAKPKGAKGSLAGHQGGLQGATGATSHLFGITPFYVNGVPWQGAPIATCPMSIGCLWAKVPPSAFAVFRCPQTALRCTSSCQCPWMCHHACLGGGQTWRRATPTRR